MYKLFYKYIYSNYKQLKDCQRVLAGEGNNLKLAEGKRNRACLSQKVKLIKYPNYAKDTHTHTYRLTHTHRYRLPGCLAGNYRVVSLWNLSYYVDEIIWRLLPAAAQIISPLADWTLELTEAVSFYLYLLLFLFTCICVRVCVRVRLLWLGSRTHLPLELFHVERATIRRSWGPAVAAFVYAICVCVAVCACVYCTAYIITHEFQYPAAPCRAAICLWAATAFAFAFWLLWRHF